MSRPLLMLGNPGHRHPVYRRLARRARRGVTWLGRITVPAAGPGVFCVDRPSVSARRPSGTDGARRSVRSPGAGPGAGNGALVQRVLAEVPELLADARPGRGRSSADRDDSAPARRLAATGPAASVRAR